MTELSCGVAGCENNSDGRCCLSEIEVGGPDANDAKQTFCEDFCDRGEGAAHDAAYYSSPKRSAEIRCEVTNCSYNCDRTCDADHVDVRTTQVNGGQVKTECSTFKTDAE